LVRTTGLLSMLHHGFKAITNAHTVHLQHHVGAVGGSSPSAGWVSYCAADYQRRAEAAEAEAADLRLQLASIRSGLAAAPGHLEAAAPGNQEAAGLSRATQQQQNIQQSAADATAAVTTVDARATGAAAGLGPAGLSLVKQELGALPSQQQLQYWQLADAPYDGAQLQALVQRYLLPRQAETLIGRANRSGRARPAKVNVADVVQQQYPLLAPSLHGLLAQVQQQPHQQQPHSSRGKGNAAVLASTCAQSPAAVVLLRALRCLQLWESRQVTQPEMPTLLQRLAGVGGGTAAAAAADADVTEVMDLTGDDEDGSGEAAAGNVEQLQAFLAGEIDLLLVREQQGVGAGAAAAVRVKDEPLD
jgi:hypothetical protein